MMRAAVTIRNEVFLITNYELRITNNWNARRVACALALKNLLFGAGDSWATVASWKAGWFARARRRKAGLVVARKLGGAAGGLRSDAVFLFG